MFWPRRACPAECPWPRRPMVFAPGGCTLALAPAAPWEQLCCHSSHSSGLSTGFYLKSEFYGYKCLFLTLLSEATRGQVPAASLS